MRVAIPLALAAVLSGCALPADTADLVLVDGVVWTNDARGTVAQALAVRDGRILAVGSTEDVLRHASATTRVVDLRGGFVGPGFRDHHTHVLERAALHEDPAAAMRPKFRPYDPVATESWRGRVAAYHLETKAKGGSPTDGCVLPPSPVTPEMKERLLAAQDAAAEQGLTTVVEAGLDDLGVLLALKELSDEGRMNVRFLVRVAWGCLEEAERRGMTTGWGDEWVRVLGVKLYADGWLGPRTSALREPYADRPLWTGVLFLEPDRAEADVRRARELGFHVATHAIGDRATAVMLDAYEAAGVRPEDRWSLEHVQVLGPDLVDRMARLGVVGSIQTSFATTDMRFAESALGPERLRWSYAWRTLDERGVRLVGSSDFDIEALHPLWGLQRVVTRAELDGTPAGGWRPDERLDVERALRLVTSDGAWAAHEEGERGTLEPGKRADLVALREDLLSMPPERIASATVVLTIVNGRIAFEGASSFPPV